MHVCVSNLGILFKGFFTRLKKILVHPILMKERDPDVSPEEHVRKLFPTLDAYRANPSAKIDRLIHCLKQHIGPDNSDAPPLYWNRDGTELAAPIMIASPSKPRHKQARRKVVVYCHLSQSWTLVAHVS
jgi:hypothetical protein